MNRPVSTRDRGHRSRTARRRSGSRGLVLGAVGLVGRTPAPEREKPPRGDPGGQCRRPRLYSALDRVAAFPVFVLGGRRSQPHLLTDGAGQEPAARRGCHPVTFISSLAVTPPARLSSTRTWLVLLRSRADFAFLAPVGASLDGVAFLADLAFFFATSARFGARGAFWVALGSSAAGPGVVPVSGVDVMVFSPLAVITTVTWITPVRHVCKAILSKVPLGEGSAMGLIRHARLSQIGAGGRARRKVRA
jgi:hypothetical protein